LATAHDSTELIAAIETLSLQLRDRIRPSLASAPKSTPLAQVTTSSLDALRKYTLAMRIWSRESDATRTLRLLEEATALDSSFAMAYRARAVVLMYTGDNERGRIQALGDAYRHRDRLSEQERYLTIATYHQSATGDIGEAVRAYQNLLELDPGNLAALNNLAVIYVEGRDFPRAEDLVRRCLAEHPPSCAFHRTRWPAPTSAGWPPRREITPRRTPSSPTWRTATR
jgi:tetratricopeptide (TPR) repeat protein